VVTRDGRLRCAQVDGRPAVDEHPQAGRVQGIGGGQPPGPRCRVAGRRRGDGRAAGRRQEGHGRTI